MTDSRYDDHRVDLVAKGFKPCDDLIDEACAPCRRSCALRECQAAKLCMQMELCPEGRVGVVFVVQKRSEQKRLDQAFSS